MRPLATLTLRERVDAPGFWVPLTALVEGDRGPWTVLAVGEDAGGAVAVREAIEVLTVEGHRAYVRAAFADGTRIVADGAHRIRPGQRLPLLLAAE